MAVRDNVESVTGTILYISASLPATYDEAGYDSTDIVWTEVNEVDDIGAEDATKATTPFVPVKTGDTTKVPGPRDFGKRTMTLGHMPNDSGQAMAKAAFLSNTAHYSFKLAFPDGELRYLDALVTKFGMTGGKAGEVARATLELDICRPPVSVLPA